MFQTKLKMLREAAGYKSQQAFANVFGVAQSTVGNWEAGKREPDFETIRRLATFFNVPVDFLIGDEDDSTYIEKSGTTICSTNPINILVNQYHIPTDVLANISGVDRATAERWILGAEKPKKDEYEHIAEFFELAPTDLQVGRLPLFPSERVQLKVYQATGMRFAAYGKHGNYTQEDLSVIQTFLNETLNGIKNDLPED